MELKMILFSGNCTKSKLLKHADDYQVSIVKNKVTKGKDGNNRNMDGKEELNKGTSVAKNNNANTDVTCIVYKQTGHYASSCTWIKKPTEKETKGLIWLILRKKMKVLEQKTLN